MPLDVSEVADKYVAPVWLDEDEESAGWREESVMLRIKNVLSFDVCLLGKLWIVAKTVSHQSLWRETVILTRNCEPDPSRSVINPLLSVFFFVSLLFFRRSNNKGGIVYVGVLQCDPKERGF